MTECSLLGTYHVSESVIWKCVFDSIYGDYFDSICSDYEEIGMREWSATDVGVWVVVRELLHNDIRYYQTYRYGELEEGSYSSFKAAAAAALVRNKEDEQKQKAKAAGPRALAGEATETREA